ncbi:MAG: RsmE family RNA methyltransferase [Planctomycetaceae bacterium]
MSSRFYLPDLGSRATVRLPPEEAHHVARVMRLKAGDSVTVFDGAGHEAPAQITQIARGEVELAIGAPREVPEQGGPIVVLGAAVPKSDRFAWLVEKAVELGVQRLVPLVTSRSVVEPRTGKLDRLRRTIIEASKQCGRSRLMTLDEPTAWADFVAREFAVGTPLIADPSGRPLGEVAIDADRPLILAVGPEGGFTPDELEAGCRNGARLIALGPWTLRVETAALALAAVVQAGRPFCRPGAAPGEA